MKKIKMRKTLVMAMAVACMLSSSALVNNIQAAFTSDEKKKIEAQPGEYGYYVDVYRNNVGSNRTTKSNPSIGVLSGFLEIFAPGSSWNNGTIINRKVHQYNIDHSVRIAKSRTKEMAEAAYLDDRRNPSYSVITGLGGYSDIFKGGTNAGTTIADTIPADAVRVKYEDKGNENSTWADEKSTYGAMVHLVNAVRSTGASTSIAKAFYRYMRPFRWTDSSLVIELLQPYIKSDAYSDGGFPSGHTSAAYLTAYALAYAVPERYHELITRASELGNNRIVAGVHSCLDVMGGRVMATAVAAAALNDENNTELKVAAYQAARELLTQEPTGADDYASYQENKEKNLYRLTYGFEQIGDTTKEMVVPKGAEVLLETRFPYLDADQRRFVLYTTGLESGYPVLDDAEGWGRLNLFEAANGYGSFVTDVNVLMDAELGGFNAMDEWKNDIDGTGSLTKNGSGSLILSGVNSYTGGTIVNDGNLVANSKTAFGTGDVMNHSKIAECVTGEVTIQGDYKMDLEAILQLNVSSVNDVLTFEGKAAYDGTLIVNVTNNFVPEGKMRLISYKEGSLEREFTNVVIRGAEGASKMEIVYEADGIYLVVYPNSADIGAG